MIEVKHLVKWYGPNLAVNDLSFEIGEGQIVGFLGPNGAGKSTTIRMLTGYLPPTSGWASVDGLDIFKESQKARSRIGYQPENTPLYPEMRVEEYLHYRGKLYGLDRATRNERIGEACEKCGLGHAKRRIIGHLSKGNRQRVGLAQALLHDPPVLILDEPTAGLDPTQIGHVRQLIRELGERHTILLSSHILPEVEKTADHVMVIARGQIVARGTPDELRRRVRVGSQIRMEVKANAGAVTSAVNKTPGVKSVDIETAGDWTIALITPEADQDPREALGQTAVTQSWLVREMRHETASLEQFFVQVTAEESAGAAEQPAQAA